MLKPQQVLKIIFYFFLTVLISQHVILFFTVNFDYADSDQVLVWLGAKHYSEGLFYEPRFYGQPYNTLMEALFAVPLIWLKVPVYYAVPIATHIIFLTPFVFTSIYLFSKNQVEKAILVLAILLCMPTGYDVMNSIPRGFVTGLFFITFFVISLINVNNLKWVLLNTFFSYVGFLVNPNSILVSVPFLFYLFLLNYKNKKYYLFSIIGLLMGLPIDFTLNHYYKIHPEAIIFNFENPFSINYFIDAVSHLDDRFAHIGLFIEESCAITLIVFILLAIYSYNKNKKWFLSFVLFLTIIIVSFFGQKIADGVVWPYFSLSRMFLAIPVFYALSIVILIAPSKKTIYVITIVVLIFITFKTITFKERLIYYAQEKLWSHVNLTSVKDAIAFVDLYKKVCEQNKASAIVIIGWTWRDDIINYAGPALYNDYPNTFKPHFERRRWRVEEEKKNVYSTFIIYTRNRDFDKTVKEKYRDITIKRLDDWGCFLISNNKRTTVNFVKYVGGETAGF